ncbi:Magnesium and cobalt efflux protein CorC [archaeon HR06]|nr:Magnesium and cobalt efflux protein CorC [archaeon HR06]
MVEVVEWILIPILLGFSAFFSAMEIALVSISNVKVKQLIRDNKPGSKALAKLKENPERMLTTILIGNNLVNIAIAALVTQFTTKLFGSLGVGISTGIATFLVLLFGEIVPKSYSLRHSEFLALTFSKVILALEYLFYPIVKFFEILTKRIVKEKIRYSISKEELKSLISLGLEEKLIDLDYGKMIKEVLEFSDTKVRAIMTPKPRIFALDSEMELKEALPLIVKKGFSRIPIVEGSINKIIGIVHVRDILKKLQEGVEDLKLRDIAKKPLFVSKEMEIHDLLREMQIKRNHMAIVLNEFGEVEGLVTLEDILEEIVGEIMDEKDLAGEGIVKVGKDSIIVHGLVDINIVNDYLKVELPIGEDYSTISGLLHDKLKDIPKRGDRLQLEDVELYVEEVENNVPTKVKIVKRLE